MDQVSVETIEAGTEVVMIEGTAGTTDGMAGLKDEMVTKGEMVMKDETTMKGEMAMIVGMAMIEETAMIAEMSRERIGIIVGGKSSC